MTPQFIDDLSVKEEDFVVMDLIERYPIPEFKIPKTHYLFNLSKMDRRKVWKDEELEDIFLLIKKPSIYAIMKRKFKWLKNLFS